MCPASFAATLVSDSNVVGASCLSTSFSQRGGSLERDLERKGVGRCGQAGMDHPPSQPLELPRARDWREEAWPGRGREGGAGGAPPLGGAFSAQGSWS